MDPVFLTIEEVLAIHRDQIERYGGSDGLRDVGLLQSAVAAPAATFDGAFLHADLFEMAAAYLFHLASNHPFVDGNKRVGAAAALVFLELNGVSFDASEDDLERTVLAVAEGRLRKSKLTEFFRAHSRA
jgi:death-on-curing protein